MKPLNLLLSSLATVMFFHHAQSQIELQADMEIESTCQQFTHETQIILRETMASVSGVPVANITLTARQCEASGVTLKPTASPVQAIATTTTKAPSKIPSTGPSSSPSTSPPTTQAPVTSDPTQTPTTTTPSSSPTRSPTSPSRSPTDVPTLAPTVQPTSVPTLAPTDAPSSVPSTAPSSAPATAGPTIGPSATPTKPPVQSLPRRMLSQKFQLLNQRRKLLQSKIKLTYILNVSATDEQQRVNAILKGSTFFATFTNELFNQTMRRNTTANITVFNFFVIDPPEPAPTSSCTMTRTMPTPIILLSGTGSTVVLASIIVVILHCQRASGKSFRPGRSKQEKKHQSELELAIQKRQQKGSGARSAAGSTVDIFAEGDGLTTGGGTGLNEGNVERARGKSELAFYDL